MQVQVTIVVEHLNNCMALVYLGIARTQTVPGTTSAMLAVIAVRVKVISVIVKEKTIRARMLNRYSLNLLPHHPLHVNTNCHHLHHTFCLQRTEQEVHLQTRVDKFLIQQRMLRHLYRLLCLRLHQFQQRQVLPVLLYPLTYPNHL